VSEARSFSLPLTLGNNPDTGDNKLNNALDPLYIAIWNVVAALDEYTGHISPDEVTWSQLGFSRVLSGGMGKLYAQATVDIPFGSMVRFTNTGVLEATFAKADIIDNIATGYCTTPGGVLTGDWGEFTVCQGINSGISGLTPGTIYYLSPFSATGQITSLRPSGSGSIVQQLGWAISSHALFCTPGNTAIIL
jgi:hypothetical protein